MSIYTYRVETVTMHWRMLQSSAVKGEFVSKMTPFVLHVVILINY